jgi:hypothetical protein
MHPYSLALVAAMPVGLSSLAAVASAALARSDRGWEVVFAHTHARAAASAVLKLVRKHSQAQGLGAVIERDARGRLRGRDHGLHHAESSRASERQGGFSADFDRAQVRPPGR